MKPFKQYLNRLSGKLGYIAGDAVGSIEERYDGFAWKYFSLPNRIAAAVIEQHDMINHPTPSNGAGVTDETVAATQAQIMEHINKLRFYQPALICLYRLKRKELVHHWRHTRKSACGIVAEAIILQLLYADIRAGITPTLVLKDAKS